MGQPVENEKQPKMKHISQGEDKSVLPGGRHVRLRQRWVSVKSHYFSPCLNLEITKNVKTLRLLKSQNSLFSFSKTVEECKFLTCADCEIGPIGYQGRDSRETIWLEFWLENRLEIPFCL